jgi:hypothetical protein
MRGQRHRRPRDRSASSLRGPALTIRRFSLLPTEADDLVRTWSVVTTPFPRSGGADCRGKGASGEWPPGAPPHPDR